MAKEEKIDRQFAEDCRLYARHEALRHARKEFYQLVVERLKLELRTPESKRLSLRQLAERINVDQSYLTKIIRNEGLK
jgi:DNA-binding MarR family transcriptional regulator